MRWNSAELAQAANWSNAIARDVGGRRTPCAGPVLTLRRSDAPPWKAGLPVPRNPGALLVRHLFAVMGLDEQRVFRWRMEHKLAQALLLEQCAPGVMPATCGLAGVLSGLDGEAACRRLQEWHASAGGASIAGASIHGGSAGRGLTGSESAAGDGAIIVKAALGEASGELRRIDRFDEVCAALRSGALAIEPGVRAYDETFILQERVRIAREYRVHSFEDRVVPELTFHRHAATLSPAGDRDAPNAVIQQLLDRMPDGLVRDTCYGWDVALDADGRWRIIEANPAGWHPVFKPGFHCSGMFQVPALRTWAIAALCRFVSEHYGVAVQIVLDAVADAEIASMYEAVARAIDVVPGGTSVRASHLDTAASLPVVEPAAIEPPPAHRLVEAQAAEQPDAVAIVCGASQLTYAALNARANRLARVLRASGVTPETRVGVCATRHAEMIVAVLAVLKAGGAYLPLALRDPEARLRDQLTDAQVPIVLVPGMVAEALPEPVRAALRACAVRAIGLAQDGTIADTPAADVSAAEAPVADAPGAGTSIVATPVAGRPIAGTAIAKTAIGSRSSANLQGATPADSLAYVIYTSGSTGRPKAVAIRHGSLTNVVCDLGRAFRVGREARWLAVTTLTFDIATLELFVPLAHGACIEMAAEEEIADGASLRRRLAIGAATVMQATPVTWRTLIDAGWIGNSNSNDHGRGNGGGSDDGGDGDGGSRTSTCFQALCGGEAMPRALAADLLARPVAAWNLYGPTETTIWSSAGPLREAAAAVSVGQPIAHTDLHVLDAGLHLQPAGAVGELYIGGAGLARGYLHRPGLTASRFVPDPLSGARGARLYRTGDLARQTSAALEILGRTDDQVKLHGIRVECGEIEAVLGAQPNVRDAAIIPRVIDDRTRLVAFLTLRPGARLVPDDVRAALRARLPEYMVPSILVPMEALPRTPNGKIDRRALARHDLPPGAAHAVAASAASASASAAAAAAADAPRTSTEAAVAAILSAVLRVETIGLDDHFIDLGGHSLAAIQCLNRFRERFGVDFPLLTLFLEAPTVRLIAALIDEQRASAPERRVRRERGVRSGRA